MNDAIAPDMISVDDFHQTAQTILDEVAKVIVGQDQVVRQVLICVVAGGHALLEGVPGLGKTMLIRTLADALDLKFCPHPVHAGSDARRHHGHEHHGRERGRAAPVPLRARADLRQPRAGRRDQPRDAQDAVGAARGHAGEDRDGRQPSLPAGPTVFRAGDPEPAGDGGHVPAAGSAARPLPVQGGCAVPIVGRAGRDHEPDDRA